MHITQKLMYLFIIGIGYMLIPHLDLQLDHSIVDIVNPIFSVVGFVLIIISSLLIIYKTIKAGLKG